MELTNAQYQRLCNVANVRHDDPSINELISAFQMQRINLVACENVVTELRAELATLSWARWVPVSERLPEKSGNYIILVDGITAYGKYDARYCEWYIIRRTLPLYITHWMPLPPAPDKK